MRTLILRSAAALAAAAAAPAYSQQAQSPAPAQVLFLGTYHFDNPGLDVVKTEVADVLLPAKQAEIAAVVEALARFRPTKIAIEARPERARLVDSLYAAFRAGAHALGRSETQQLGFRLAARFGHERLYAIDHGGEFPFEAVMAYAQQHDPAFLQRMQGLIGQITEVENRMQREMTIGGILRFKNDPEMIREGHAFYMEIGRIGAGDTFVGADLVSAWYDRNLRIFSNLQRIAEAGDRILVIYGSGHAATLREFVRATANMQLVEALDYLPAA
ncbi:MAG TPA: DUF5694 domain-containing protein [Longimicrobium sp.]|nr:DUF5694 domain-containing protein [Longimicrobium sp.]